ncbi:MAG: hypothetical protein QM527_08780 [Alphaproteobacteria bacterium]|nr:hypothetical protein [Alphaproteobacteria bacterium]
MSQSTPFDFSKFVPGFDFLQKLATAPNQGAPSVSSWVAPTLDPKELEKRIQDLRTVQFWLEQNTQAVAATIQALEVQRMTLATLQGMNVSMGQLVDALKVSAPDAANKASAEPPAAPANPGDSAPKKARSSKSVPMDGAASTPTGGIDPMAWWGSLTQQFQQIAGDAMQDMQRKAQSMAPAEPPRPNTASSAAAPRKNQRAKPSRAAKAPPQSRKST